MLLPLQAGLFSQAYFLCSDCGPWPSRNYKPHSVARQATKCTTTDFLEQQMIKQEVVKVTRLLPREDTEQRVLAIGHCPVKLSMETLSAVTQGFSS